MYNKLFICSIFIFGCGDGSAGSVTQNIPNSCVPGTSITCTCVSGQSGAQVCKSDGTYAECICSTSDHDAMIQDAFIDSNNDIINTTDSSDVSDSASELSEADVVKCDPGSIGCDGKFTQTCDANGKWQKGTECQYICDNGACKGNCLPGDTKCNGQALQFCDTTGEWKHKETCPYVCDQSHNPPECVGHWCCGMQNADECLCWGIVQACNTWRNLPDCNVGYSCCILTDSNHCWCYNPTKTCDELLANIKQSYPDAHKVDKCPQP